MSNEPIDLKRYHSENANRYADLMSMLQDLNEAALHFHAGELACARPAPDTATQLLAKAHWLAGATLYGRVFKGVARVFDRDAFIAALRSDLAEFHRWLLSMHEKHVSHAGNLFEEVIPTVGRVNGDTGVGYLGIKVINPRQSVMHQCNRFVTEVIRLVQIEADQAYRRFQTEAETLDDQFLQALPPASQAVAQRQYGQQVR